MMMKENEEIPILSDVMEEPEEVEPRQQQQQQQHHYEIDATSEPSATCRDDDHLVGDSTIPVSSVHGAIIIPKTNDDDKETVTTTTERSTSVELADDDQKQSSHLSGSNRIDHDLILKKLEMTHRHRDPSVDHNHNKTMTHGEDIIYDDSKLDNNSYEAYDNNAATNQSDNTRVTDHQQPRGAIHAAGIDALSTRDARDDNVRPVRVEPAYLESSSGLHVLQDGQTMIGSMTFEVEGFVPSVIEPPYLVPEENIQRIAHMYASVEPTDQHAPTSHENNDREQHHHRRHVMRKYLNTIHFVGVLIALIVSGIVVIAVCGLGLCHRDSQESQNGQPYQSNDKSFGKQNETNYYKSFSTKQELMDAIDRFQSNQNFSSLEATYGSIAQWNVSQIQDFSYLFSPFEGQRLRTSLFNEDISRWDVSAATNMSYMFYGAQAFVGDISKWNVSRVTDMQYFMAQAYKFDGNLSQWNTSQFVNTSHMFYSTINFTGIGLEDWTLGKVYDMTSMFEAKYECYAQGSPGFYCKSFTKFNRNLSNWNVSNVHYMTSLFTWASSFKGVGVEDWDTSQVETMSLMFSGASLFDANLTKWNVSNVQDTSYMFEGASSFQGVGIEDWDTSQVVTMSGMFHGAKSSDANLSKWNVSNVQDTSYMFADASSFQGVGVEVWDTSQVETMSLMFIYAYSFDANLSKWNVSNVKDTSHMFYFASSFQGVGLEDWDTSQVETMSWMFYYASSFDANLSKWNLSNVNDTSGMFNSASSFQGVGMEDWDTSQVKTMSGMFKSEMFGVASSFDANLSKWNVSNVQDTSYMFADASSFQGVGVEDWDTSQVVTMSNMFYEASSFDANFSKWNVSNVQDTSYMFQGASLFQGVGVEDWDTSKVETMSFMFAFASSFNANLSKWNVSNVNDTSRMFYYASSFQGVGVEDWDTSKVEMMGGMFHSASSFDANLSKWNVSNVQDTSLMFSGMYFGNYSVFQGVGIEDWDTSKVKTMRWMFGEALAFDSNLSKWNLSNVQDTSDMFQGASSFQGIGIEAWDTSNVKTMSGMFDYASSFDANLSSWDVANVFDMSFMFHGASSFRGVGLDVWNVSRVNHTEFMFDSATAFHTNLSNWDVSNVENATSMFRNATFFAGVPWWNETSDTIMK